jgi:flagellar basal-body rod protein FlgB
MSSNNIGLLNAISAKIDYLSRRQEIVAQNIANADTPNYRPQDLTEMDFGALIGRGASSDTLQLETTRGQHMLAGGVMPGEAKEKNQKFTYEVAPAGNAVILEEQLVKSGTNKMEYDLMVNLYQKNINLLRTALGTGR